jgi:FAD/FMN-containing dehydrogenase
MAPEMAREGVPQLAREGAPGEALPAHGSLASEPAALSPHEEAFYGPGVRAVAPSSFEELVEIVRHAEARKMPVIPAGEGAHAYLGNPPPPDPLVVSLRKLRRVLRYEPADFTVGVHAGLPLRELREILEKNGQEIPVDLPRAAKGTVGGLVASAPPGPRRGRYGPLRSFILGAAALRGGPAMYRVGGMVVKNVAGYEVAKFLAGSLGTTGFLLEANFKLRPIPAKRSARAALFSDRTAAWSFARDLRAKNIDPAALWLLDRGGALELRSKLRLDSFDPEGHVVLWIFEGNAGETAWQEKTAGSLLAASRPEAAFSLPLPDLDSLLDFLYGFSRPGASPPQDLGIARLGVLPAALKRLEEKVGRFFVAMEGLRAAVAADALSGLLTVRWTGPPGAVAEPVKHLARIAREEEGSGVLVYLPPAFRRAEEHLLVPDPNWELTRKILKAFDPAGIFCPGRTRIST